MMEWKNYDYEKHQEIDLWNLANQEINQYAMYGERLSDSVNWYHSNVGNMSNIKDHVFVIEEESQLVGFIISNVAQMDNKKIASINPIVINPYLLHQGYAKRILLELIEKRSILYGMDIDIFLSMIHIKNFKSTRLFEHLGFQAMHEDDGFIEYQLNIGGKDHD